jgi:hypothetical protein
MYHVNLLLIKQDDNQKYEKTSTLFSCLFGHSFPNFEIISYSTIHDGYVFVKSYQWTWGEGKKTKAPNEEGEKRPNKTVKSAASSTLKKGAAGSSVTFVAPY